MWRDVDLGDGKENTKRGKKAAVSARGDTSWRKEYDPEPRIYRSYCCIRSHQ